MGLQTPFANLIWEFWGKGKPLPLLPDGPVAARIDAFIDRSRPNTNEGANEVLLAGAPGPTRAIVSFDLPQVPDTVISEALLVLTLIEPAAGWPDGGGILNAHRLKAVIQEGNGMDWGRVQREGDGVGVTWNCRRDRHIENDWPDCGHKWSGGDHRVGTPAIIFDPLRIENGITGQIVWDVREQVREALREGARRITWLIQKEDEDDPGQVIFYSREGAGVTGDLIKAPYLAIE